MTTPPPDPELKRLGNHCSGRGGPRSTGYDSDAGRFRIIFFSNNGPYTEDGNRYEGVVEEGTLTFEGPARFQYRLDDAGKIRVNDDGTISVAWWLRDENGEWQPWMDNRFSRVEG
jgi:hypothetical protein